MRFNVISLFPEMFSSPFASSIVKRAIDKGIIEINLVNIRDFARDKHRLVDDYPYGGGAGMILKPEPIFDAVEDIKSHSRGAMEAPIILLTPQGRTLNQKIVEELSKIKNIILISGRYEGIDERIVQHLITDEISLGDYVLSGGELPAMIIVDAVTRLLPGVLGSQESLETDTFYHGKLKYPQYTRPFDYRGYKVPEVLLSGHHKNIEYFRLKESLRRTLNRRPDLLEGKTLSEEEERLIEKIKNETTTI
jgi:tRNA (guanine37-N1)-methyltransferase